MRSLPLNIIIASAEHSWLLNTPSAEQVERKVHPSFSPLAEAWGKRLKLSIRESQHSYQTKGEHPIVIRFLTYAENSASQSSAQPSPPSEDTEEEQSNGATTRTATSTSYQDGLVICVDIMFIFSNCIVYNNFTL